MDVAGDDDDDVRLSAHIRHLLLDYIPRYLTTDYIQFTEIAVAELVILSEIPTEDPKSLVLPTDPFTTLTNLLQLQVLQPYDEKLQTSKEVQTFIKNMLRSKQGKVESERVIDSLGVDQHDLMVHRPVSPPILTRRALRETPVIGSNKCGKKTFKDFINARPVEAKLEPVEVEQMQEPDVNINQVLDLMFQLHAAEHTSVRELLKSFSVMCRPLATADKALYPYLPHNFLLEPHAKVEPASPRPDSPPFMPIFPRRAPVCPRTKTLAVQGGSYRVKNTTDMVTRTELNSVADLPAFVGAEPTSTFGTADEKALGPGGRQVYEENMVIVDGWHTYATSSPSVLSSADDDEVDQLLLVSSPNTELSPTNLVKEVEDSKLEEIQIPRARRIGGRASMDKDAFKIGKVLDEGLGPFLGPLLKHHPAVDSDARIINEKKSGLGNTADGDDDSMLGQPPSLSSITAAVHPRPQDSWKDTDAEIRAIYATADDLAHAHLKQHPNDLIRHEMLFDEEKENQQSLNKKRNDMVVRLMAVPPMPAPNAHVIRSTSGFRSLKSYIVGSNKGIQSKPGPLQFLRTVKGMASLRVSLSWVPFTVTSPTDLPNHERSLEIDSLSCDAVGELQMGGREVEKLLERSLVAADNVKSCVGDVVERLWAMADREGRKSASGGDNEFSPEIARCEIILTREERRALARSMEGVQDDKEERPMIHEEDGSRSSDSDAILPDKKTRLSEDYQGDNTTERPAKRPRLAETVDDSGVGLMSADISIGVFDQVWNCHQPQEDGVQDFVGDDAFYRRNHSHEDDNLNMLNDGDYDEAMLTESCAYGSYSYSNTYDNNYCDYGEDEDLPNANKENCPPPITAMVSDLEHGTHRALYQYSSAYDASGDGQLRERELDDPHTENSGRPYVDKEDYTGGFFEPLPLSFDSQAYQVTKQFPAQSQIPSWDDQIPRIVDYNYELEEDLDARSSLHGLASVRDTRDWDTTQEVAHRGKDQFKARDVDLGDAHPGNLSFGIDTNNDAYMNMDLATRSLGVDGFAILRARTIKPSVREALPPSSQPPSSSAATSGLEQEEQPPGPRRAPQNLYDRKTLRLPSPWISPTNAHRYMASLDVLQKQVLVRSLRTSDHLVHLMERYSLGGVDLILDPYTAVIFAHLLSLPSQCDSLLSRVSAQSYRYKQLLVVFEAYPASRSFKPTSRLSEPTGSDLYAYTPPIVKAVKKFRRNLDIGEACGTKAATCKVMIAFADSVDECAAYARHFGDIAEERDDTQGAIWGRREWLDLEIAEDEASLASVAGMNYFSAAIVLSQVSAQQYLDMTPEGRIESFGRFIGVEAVTICNAELEERMQNQSSDLGEDKTDSNFAPV